MLQRKGPAQDVCRTCVRLSRCVAWSWKTSLSVLNLLQSLSHAWTCRSQRFSCLRWLDCVWSRGSEVSSVGRLCASNGLWSDPRHANNTVSSTRNLTCTGRTREKLKVPLDLFPWKQQVTADSCKSFSLSLEPKVAECLRVHN